MSPPPSTEPQQPPTWVSLIPAVILGVLSAILVLWLAPRKGCSRWLALVAFIPCVGYLVVLYLLSLTDKRVLDEIENLKKQMNTPHSDEPKA